jgi:hypothetical protein
MQEADFLFSQASYGEPLPDLPSSKDNGTIPLGAPLMELRYIASLYMKYVPEH